MTINVRMYRGTNPDTNTEHMVAVVGTVCAGAPYFGNDDPWLKPQSFGDPAGYAFLPMQHGDQKLLNDHFHIIWEHEFDD